MYDNIFVQFKDAKFSITAINAWFWCIFLEIKKRFKPPTAFDYAMLSNAYNEYNNIPLFRRLTRYYAIKAIRLKRDYAYPYIILGQLTSDPEKIINYSKKAIKFAGNDYYIAYFILFPCLVFLERWNEVFEYGQKYFKITNDDPNYMLYSIYINTVLKEKSTKKLIKLSLKSCIKYKDLPSINCILFFINLCICWKIYTNENIYYRALDNKFYNIALQIANKQLLKKKDADWFLRKAICLFYLARYQKSLVAIDNAEQLKPDCTQTDYNFWRALISTKLCEYDKSMQYINKSIVLSPTDYKYTHKAMLLNKLEEYTESIEIFKKAIEQYGFSALTGTDLYFLAQNYYYIEDYQNALSTINNCLIKEQDAENCYLKYLILESMEENEEAEIWYKKYEELSED